MPQTFQVLRCYKCAIFQVHPTKKATKWKCKVCGEKQSIKRFYGLGTAKECRLHVQKLNGIRGDIDNAKDDSIDSDVWSNTSDSPKQNDTPSQAVTKKSKWLNYVDVTNDDTRPNLGETAHVDNDAETELVLNLPKKRARNSVKLINKSSNLCYEHSLSTKFINNYPENNIVNSLQCKPESLDTSTKTDIVNKTVPTTTSHNSKWAQFIDETQSSNDQEPVTNNEDSQNVRKSMFSLFDDDNIDDLLDF